MMTARSERKQMGKALRQQTPLGSRGQWTPAADRPDPLALLQALDETGLQTYLAVCSWCLAWAHARTWDKIQIRGYLGKKDTLAQAIGDFAVAYADQTERDYETLVKAVKDGRIAAETGI